MNSEKNHIEKREPFFESIDFLKLTEALRKSWIWMALIMVAAMTASYLFIRYTKPVYESSSVLKLDIKSEATVFGFNSYEENLNNLSGERELLLSRLFHEKMLDEVNLDVSYYAYGNFLYDERYGNSPFKARYEVYDAAVYDVPLDVELLNNDEYLLECQINDETYSDVHRFGEAVKNRWFSLTLELTRHYSPNLEEKRYFFTINSRERLLDYISANMNVDFLSLNAKTIQVSFRDYNRFKARDLVNAIDTLYIKYTHEEKKKANGQKIQFLNEQLRATEEKLENAEDYFESFTIDNMTTNLQADLNKTIAQLEALDTQRYEANSRLNFLNDLYERVIEGQALYVSPLNKEAYSQEILSDIAQLSELEKERKTLLTSYKESTYAVRKKDQEISFVRNRLIGQIQDMQRRQYETLKKLNEEKKKLEKNFVELPAKGTEFNKSTRYYALYEDFYLSLMQRKTEFEIAQAGTVTDFVILSPATYPTEPIYPPKLIIYGIGALAGLMLSFFVAGGRYLLHNKVTSQQELESLTSAPILGVIPFHKNGAAHSRLVVNERPRSTISEALRTIRTNMEFVNIAKEKKVISVTSTVSGEGKTFVALNLGAIIAFTGQRVALVDLDMRKPRIGHAFDNDQNSKGVSSLLIGKHDLDECIFPTEVETLKYIPSGPLPPNPSELLMSGAFDKLLDKLKNAFDVVILDTPPIGLVTDGMLIMNKADLPIYVFRSDYSRRAFTKTLNKLAEVNNFHNIAVVLNAVKSHKGRSYGYGYSYYHNGAGYYDDTAGKSNGGKVTVNKLSG